MKKKHVDVPRDESGVIMSISSIRPRNTLVKYKYNIRVVFCVQLVGY